MGTRKGRKRYRSRMHVLGAGVLQGHGPDWRESVCFGHIGQLWDNCDPKVKTLTCAEKHIGKLRRLFLFPSFLTTGTSNQQAAAIKECTLTNSK